MDKGDYGRGDGERLGLRRAKKAQGKGKPQGGNFPKELSGEGKSHPERLAAAGSEFCVVIRDDGTKRKQRVPKPCD